MHLHLWPWYLVTLALYPIVCRPASITKKTWPSHGHSPAAQPPLAVVELHEAGGSGVSGSLRIRPYGENQLIIYGMIHGLENGTHGFHVHEHGSIGNDCMDAGGHFNPEQAEPHHVGDLGTIFTKDDSKPTFVDVVDDVITHGDASIHDIAGLSIVVHGSMEGVGKGKPRVACGIIVDYVEPTEDNAVGQSSQESAVRAVVELHEARGSGVNGTLTLEPDSQGNLRITGKVYGLEPGTHGFHVHEHGSIGNDCMDAGGHFNPYNTEDHVGDIGTIFTPEGEDGLTKVDVVDDVITLGDDGFHDIEGLSIVIHGSRELGQGKPRVACGIIKLVSLYNIV